MMTAHGSTVGGEVDPEPVDVEVEHPRVIGGIRRPIHDGVQPRQAVVTEIISSVGVGLPLRRDWTIAVPQTAKNMTSEPISK